MTSVDFSENIERKTVLLFIDSLGSGGAQRQLVTLANALADKKYRVYLVTYYPYWHFREMVDRDAVELIYLPRGSKIDILFIFRLARLLNRLKPDVVLSYLFTPNVLIRLAGLISFGHRKIITSERNIDLQRSRMRLLIESVLSNLSDCVVTNAAATRDMLVENSVCPPSKISVIPNGVDTRLYSSLSADQREVIRAERGIRPDSFLILLPGRIQVQKNHISLLRALTQIEGIDDRCEVLFVGDIIDAGCKQNLDTFIAENLPSLGIHFSGQCDDMNGVYEIADLVVLPSLFEGLPNVVIEAMHKAKLIAISNTSDNAQIIKHGSTGFIHEVNDDKHLAQIISKTMDMDAAEVERMTQAAHHDFNSYYTVDAMLQNYIKVFS